MFKKAKYVYEIYKIGSFTGAAKKLGVSQPCLSSAIKNIEDKLGTPIFERGSSPVVLTPAGKEYIKVTERIFSLQEAFLHKVEDLNTLDCGQLRVGCPSHIMLYVLEGVLKDFTEKYPRISVEIREGSSDELQALLKDGEIDILVGTFEGSAQTSLSLEPIREENLLFVTPTQLAEEADIKKYAIAPSELYANGDIMLKLKKPLPLELMRGKSFILMKHTSPLYEYSKFALQSAGVFVGASPARIAEQESTAYAFAKHGTHSTFLQDTVFKQASLPDDVCLFTFDGAPRTLLLAAATKKGKPTSPAMSSFIEILKQTLKSQ